MRGRGGTVPIMGTGRLLQLGRGVLVEPVVEAIFEEEFLMFLNEGSGEYVDAAARGAELSVGGEEAEGIIDVCGEASDLASVGVYGVDGDSVGIVR